MKAFVLSGAETTSYSLSFLRVVSPDRGPCLGSMVNEMGPNTCLRPKYSIDDVQLSSRLDWNVSPNVDRISVGEPQSCPACRDSFLAILRECVQTPVHLRGLWKSLRLQPRAFGSKQRVQILTKDKHSGLLWISQTTLLKWLSYSYRNLCTVEGLCRCVLDSVSAPRKESWLRFAKVSESHVATHWRRACGRLICLRLPRQSLPIKDPSAKYKPYCRVLN